MPSNKKHKGKWYSSQLEPDRKFDPSKAELHPFNLFVRGKHCGTVLMAGDNSGHARARFLEQAGDKRSEYVTLAPKQKGHVHEQPDG